MSFGDKKYSKVKNDISNQDRKINDTELRLQFLKGRHKNWQFRNKVQLSSSKIICFGRLNYPAKTAGVDFINCFAPGAQHLHP